MVLICNRLKKFARGPLVGAIDGATANFRSIGDVLDQFVSRGHLRRRGHDLNLDFAAYMSSKLSILLSTPPKSGSASSVLALKNDFENI